MYWGVTTELTIYDTGSLGRHVQFSSVIATVSVFNPENSVAPPTTLGPGVPDIEL